MSMCRLIVVTFFFIIPVSAVRVELGQGSQIQKLIENEDGSEERANDIHEFLDKARSGVPDASLVLQMETYCGKGVFIATDFEGEDMTQNTKLMEAFEPPAGGVKHRYVLDRNPRGQMIPYLKGLKLKRQTCLVFLGDALDSDGNKKRKFAMRTALTLIHLKVDHPNQVLLILGNRDVNKMRLTSELVLPSSVVGHFYWLAGKDENPFESPLKSWQEPENDICKETNEPAGKASWGNNSSSCGATPDRLKNIFAGTMGAGATFDNLKEEVNAKSDQEVVDFVYQSITGGIMQWYIELAQVIGAAKLANDKYAIFVHGGLHPDMFKDGGYSFPDKDKTEEPLNLNSKTVDRSAADDTLCIQQPRTNKKPGMTTYVKKWAAWKDKMYGEWKAVLEPKEFIERGLPVAASRPGTQLMDMGLGTLGGTYRNAGFWRATPIVEFRWGQHPEMLEPGATAGTKSAAEFFNTLKDDYNVVAMFVGHFCETGRVLPELYQYDGFQVANLDVTFKDDAVNKFSPWNGFFKEKGYTEVGAWKPEASFFKTTMDKDGKIEIDGFLKKSTSTVNYQVKPMPTAAQGIPVGAKVVEETQNMDLVFGPQNSAKKALWQEKMDWQGNLRAYPVAEADGKTLYKVNHRMGFGFPPGASWYYQTK